jgi:hypothetical protein
MPWIIFAKFAVWPWQEEAADRELELDHLRWDGESPAFRGDD